MAPRKSTPKVIEVPLVADRVTKGAVRFMEETDDQYPLNVYLRKEQVAELGVQAEVGQTITLSLSA